MATDTDIKPILNEFEDLSQEFKSLVDVHKDYINKLEALGSLQAKCVKELSHQRYRLTTIKKNLKTINKTSENKADLEELDKRMLHRKVQLDEMKEALPKMNGLYLRIILGNVNVSILNKDDKFKYKDEYEKFKFIINGIGLTISIINIMANSRLLDLVFMFLLVWYYCTLTIRESILKVNGSRVKGWWRLHHFISTVLSGVLLIWPNNSVYYEFRSQFMWFNVYISFVQFLQFRYQQGCLYRLRALGERHNMDITIEGFHSWMWRGLSFLLPFLFFGYFLQLYNAYLLYHLSFHVDSTWQSEIKTKSLAHKTQRLPIFQFLLSSVCSHYNACTFTLLGIFGFPSFDWVDVIYHPNCPASADPQKLSKPKNTDMSIQLELNLLNFTVNIVGYLWIYVNPDVPVLSVLFFTVFLGNIVTTMMVIPQKLKEKVNMKERFVALDKYFRRHNREPENDNNRKGERNARGYGSNAANSNDVYLSQSSKTGSRKEK